MQLDKSFEEQIVKVLKTDSVENFKALLYKTGDPKNLAYKYGLLHEAASAGSVRILKYLLTELYINVHITGCSAHMTALYTAAESGKIDCLTMLLNCGANPNQATSEGSTALHIAAQNGHIDCVKALIAAGANLNQTNKSGVTPLRLALICYDKMLNISEEIYHPENNIYKKIIKLLIKAGAQKTDDTSEDLDDILFCQEDTTSWFDGEIVGQSSDCEEDVKQPY